MANAFRNLQTMLFSGVAIQRAFEIASSKSFDTRTKTALAGVVEEIKRGSDISSAMKKQEVFPDLVLDMVDVAEQTGSLPEVLQALADHYENNLRLRSNFIQQIT